MNISATLLKVNKKPVNLQCEIAIIKCRYIGGQRSTVKDCTFCDFLSSLKFSEEISRCQVMWQSWYPARILVLNNHLFVLSSLSKIQQKLKDTIIIFENYGRKIFIKSWYIPMILIDPYLMNLPTLCNVYRI